MRKFLFLFLTMLCMLVSQGLRAQDLIFDPENGSSVESGTTISEITFNCTEGIELCSDPTSFGTDSNNNTYGKMIGSNPDYLIPIYNSGGVLVAYAEWCIEYGDSKNSDGSYTFTLVNSGLSGEETSLTDEDTYHTTIPAGYFLLGENKDACQETYYSFTIGEEPTSFDLSFELGDYSDAAHSVKVTLEADTESDLNVVEGKSISVTGGTSDITANAVQGTDDNWYIKFPSSLNAGQYTITIPAGYFTTEDGAENVEATATYTKEDPTAIVGSGDVVWAFDEGNSDHSATISKDAITAATVSIGEELEYYGTEYIVSNKETSTAYGKAATFTLIQPSFVDGTQKETKTSADDKNAVDFTLTIEEGYTFTPTSISFCAVGCGTDGGNVDATWYASDEDEGTTLTQLVGKSTLARDKTNTKDADSNTIYSEEDFTLYESEETQLENISASSGTCKLRINIYGLTNNKQAGLSNIVISGTAEGPNGTEPATFEITLNPDGTTDVQSISEITVTPAEGYTISGITDDTSLEITLTATIDDDDEVSYTGTATVEDGTATITFADEEEKAITTEGEYTLTIPAGYFVTAEGATSEEATATYTVVATTGDEEPGPEVEYPATATWDWQNDIPTGINADTNIQGTTGTVASNVEGIELYVDATCDSGKLSTNGGTATDPTYDYVQMNTGTIVRIPVTSTSDVITVTSYSGQYHYTIGETTATKDTEVYTPTETDVTAGYVEMIATGTAYLYSIVADLQGPDNEGGDEGGSSIELLDKVEDGVYAITKRAEELLEMGFLGDESYCYATYDTGTILYDDDNIKIEVATDQTYVANSGYQLSDIQAEYSDYTAFINMGVASGSLDTIDENSGDPTQCGASWQGMLKVAPTVDGTLTFNVHTGENSRTLAIYEVGTGTWINITHDVVGFGSASADLTAGNEYVLVCNGTNNNLYQISFTTEGEEQTGPGPEEEGLLYSTDFTEWETIDRTEANGDQVTVTTTTSGELTFTLWGVGVDPTKTDESKFPGYVGTMITSKYPSEYAAYEPYALTSTLGTLDKIEFIQVATGNTRGIKISVMGDEDDDWVAIHNQTIGNAKGETVTLDSLNRTNCRIKIEGFNLEQNGYIADLKIYGTDGDGTEPEATDTELYEELKLRADTLGVYLDETWMTLLLEYPEETIDSLQSTYDAIHKEVNDIINSVGASHCLDNLAKDEATIIANIEAVSEEIANLYVLAAGIKGITIEDLEAIGAKGIYTISGQKVSAPTKAGIYIIDGKKVVFK